MIRYIINQERNNRPYAEIPVADHVNKSNSCLGAKVPGNESSMGAKVPRHFCSGEREFQGTFRNSSSCDVLFLQLELY